MSTISNFTSIFEVSIAIHLAYSLLREIHSREIVNIEKMLDRLQTDFNELSKIAEISEVDKNSFRTGLWLIEMGLLIKLSPHEKIIKMFSRLSIGIAFISVLVLIFAGFYPDTEIPVFKMLLLLFILLLPMPTMIIITKIIMKPGVAEMHQLLINVNKEMCELRETYWPDHTKES